MPPSRVAKLERAFGGVRRLAGGTVIDIALYTFAFAFAVLIWRHDHLIPHQLWGRLSWPGYLVGIIGATALTAWGTQRRWGTRTWLTARAWLLGTVVLLTAFLPLASLVQERAEGAPRRSQSEVNVVETAALRLKETGSPYMTLDELSAPGGNFTRYVAYTPAMTVFGFPRAVFGLSAWTDARVFLTASTMLAVILAMAVGIRSKGARLRAIQVLAVVPPAALTIATGGDDLPVIGLGLLAVALASRQRWWATGLAAGAAVALKVTALPLAIVLGLFVLAAAPTEGRGLAGGPTGWRHRLGALARYSAGAVLLPVATTLPVILHTPAAMLENAVRFPLGLAEHHSPAASPMLGWWIAHTFPGGRHIAIGLLVTCAVGLGLWLVRHPPRSPSAVAGWAALGLTVAIVLEPATRFGYLMYPLCLAVWAVATRSAPVPVPAPVVTGPRVPATVR